MIFLFIKQNIKNEKLNNDANEISNFDWSDLLDKILTNALESLNKIFKSNTDINIEFLVYEYYRFFG